MYRRSADLLNIFHKLSSRRVLIFSLLPILGAVAMTLGWECRASGMAILRGWLDPSPLAAASPSGAVAQATDLSQIPPTVHFPGDSILEEDPSQSSNTEALALATHQTQELKAELNAVRAELADTQWDLTLWSKQAITAEVERNRAEQQVEDLSKQLRENLIELNALQQSVEKLQRQSVSNENRQGPHLRMAEKLPATGSTSLK